MSDATLLLILICGKLALGTIVIIWCMYSCVKCSQLGPEGDLFASVFALVMITLVWLVLLWVAPEFEALRELRGEWDPVWAVSSSQYYLN